MVKRNDDLCIVTIRELMEHKEPPKQNLGIPEYQRPYKWSPQSVLTLINDIYTAFKNNMLEYRIGTVVLHNTPTQLNIVDGQQRLTTLSILFFAIGESGNNIKKLSSSLLDAKYNELSSEAIVRNLSVIRKRLLDFEKQELEDYSNYLLDHCTVVKIVTKDEQEAFQFFDSQNSRGKALAPHDLLKSYHLREMNDESESLKIDIVNTWESTKQSDLENLFADNLFPLIRWYKNKDGLNYSINQIDVFKGIKKSNNYNFSIYNKASNLYVEKFNYEGLYELASSKALNQFQLTQPLIAGSRFFKYTQHYLNLYKTLEKRIFHSFNAEEIIQSGSGDTYIYNLFINILMFYVDRFNINSLTETRLLFFYKWAYSLRVCMKAVYRESINKYARGKSERLNSGLNLFSVISDMQDPMELDTIILDIVSEDTFKNSKVNTERYRKVFDKISSEGNI